MITTNDFLRVKMLSAHKSKEELNDMNIPGSLVLKLLEDYALNVLAECQIQASNGLESVTSIRQADTELATRFNTIKEKIQTIRE